ncbi:hypothetical protein SETIT_5G039600v2 [Setaria italica]|uniref:Uncharacterized protein n=1 Tax=Setaria italica TaxID=4555 RepID=A0A368R0Z7_SETIT|nr:hypothetical protein SETIT_5G039600v2 [Setaria italica]
MTPVLGPNLLGVNSNHRSSMVTEKDPHESREPSTKLSWASPSVSSCPPQRIEVCGVRRVSSSDGSSSVTGVWGVRRVSSSDGSSSVTECTSPSAATAPRGISLSRVTRSSSSSSHGPPKSASYIAARSTSSCFCCRSPERTPAAAASTCIGYEPVGSCSCRSSGRSPMASKKSSVRWSSSSSIIISMP